MRFKQLTLFMAAMTAAGTGVTQSPASRWWIALAAFIIAAVMWVVEVRATLNAIAAHDAIPEVFPRQKKRFMSWLNSSWAVLSLHVVCYWSWWWCLRIWSPGCVAFYVGIPFGALLIVFSAVNYWQHKEFWLGRKGDA